MYHKKTVLSSNVLLYHGCRSLVIVYNKCYAIGPDEDLKGLFL